MDEGQNISKGDVKSKLANIDAELGKKTDSIMQDYGKKMEEIENNINHPETPSIPEQIQNQPPTQPQTTQVIDEINPAEVDMALTNMLKEIVSSPNVTASNLVQFTQVLFKKKILDLKNSFSSAKSEEAKLQSIWNAFGLEGNFETNTHLSTAVNEEVGALLSRNHEIQVYEKALQLLNEKYTANANVNNNTFGRGMLGRRQ